MSFFIDIKLITGEPYKDEMGVRNDKDGNKLQILERVVTFELSKDRKALKATENCDDWFCVDLPKYEVKLLIDGLQELYDKMEVDHHDRIE